MNKVQRFPLAVLAALTFFVLATGCQQDESALPAAEPAVVDTDLTDGRYNLILRESAIKSSALSDRKAGLNFKQDLMRQEATRVLQDAGIGEKSFSQVFVNAIKGVSLELSAAEAEALAGSPAVAYLMKVRPMSIPRIIETAPEEAKEEFGNQRAGQALPWGIRRVGGFQDGTGKTAWILDTGIDFDHPDLLVDTDRAVSMIAGESADDGFGHGTHVAGTVAALDNGFGVVGVAAGALVVPVKVLSNAGFGSDAEVIAGVDYTLQHAGPGDVANMSLGGGESPILDAAVLNAAELGLRFVIAAGNGNIFGIAMDAATVSPARVNHENILTISASHKWNGITIFSNYSATIIDYAAPGRAIASCFKGGSYKVYDGTSMAAPHVTGLWLMGDIVPRWQLIYDWDGVRDWIAHRE